MLLPTSHIGSSLPANEIVSRPRLPHTDGVLPAKQTAGKPRQSVIARRFLSKQSLQHLSYPHVRVFCLPSRRHGVPMFFIGISGYPVLHPAISGFRVKTSRNDSSVRLPVSPRASGIPPDDERGFKYVCLSFFTMFLRYLDLFHLSSSKIPD